MSVRSYTGEKYYFLWEIKEFDIRCVRESPHFWLDDNKLFFMFGAKATGENKDDLGLYIIFVSKPKIALEISTYIREECGRLQLLSSVREDFASFEERNCAIENHYCVRLLSNSEIEQSKVTKDKHVENSTFTFIFSFTDIVQCFSDIEKKIRKPTIEKQLCLEKFSDDMKDLFESQGDTDIELKCKDRSLRAHRIILAARSKVFADMFRNELPESQIEFIDIPDMYSEIIMKFVIFLYSGIIELSSKSAILETYYIANKYCVPTLRNMCASFVVENLETYEIQDICNILDLADVYGDTDLLDAVSGFAVQKERFISSPEWLELAEENLELAGKVFIKYHRKYPIV